MTHQFFCTKNFFVPNHFQSKLKISSIVSVTNWIQKNLCSETLFYFIRVGNIFDTSLRHQWDILETPREYNFYKKYQHGWASLHSVTILKIVHLSPEAVVTWAVVSASFIASWVELTEWTNFNFIPFECDLKLLSFVQLSPWAVVAWTNVPQIRASFVASWVVLN